MAGELTEADRRRAGWRLVVLGLGMVAITLIGPPLHRGAGDIPFNLLGVTHGLLTIRAVQLATRAERRFALWVILGVAVAMRLALLPVHPHLSSDAFRYVWDGRVQGAGINPYRYLPAAPELAFLRDAAVYPFINRAEYAVTIYPPAAQMLFFLINRIADGLVPLKLVFLAFEAVAAWVILDLLRRIGQPAQRVVAYAWHPLAVWEIAGNAHIDGPMVALTMLGVWLVIARGRAVTGAATMALGAMMKPLAAIALPLAWRPPDWRAPVAAVAIVVLVYIPYLSVGTGMFSFAGGYAREERLDSGDTFWPVWLLNRAVGVQPWAKYLYLALAAAILLVLALRVSWAFERGTEERLRRLSWLVFAGLLALSPYYPWYWLLLVPFLALFGRAPFWAATVSAYLLYDEIWGDPHLDLWVRDAAHNLIILAALAWAWWRSREARAPAP